jgi:hypothetical protein
MDLSAFIPWISPIITAVITYIKAQGVQKAGDKAAEVIGEKATEMTMSIGQKALTVLRSKFSVKADTKAQQALENVEQDPDDEDYQHKLVKETARLASTDPVFAQELKVLAENVSIAQSGGVTIDNKASNYGAQGVFNAPINFDQRLMKDIPHERG